MSALSSGLLAALIGLVTSKKFITGAATAVASTLIKDPHTAMQVAAIGSSVVLGFAAQDFGKEKAKIEADTILDNTP